jgi:hypothetical protein
MEGGRQGGRQEGKARDREESVDLQRREKEGGAREREPPNASSRTPTKAAFSATFRFFFFSEGE